MFQFNLPSPSPECVNFKPALSEPGVRDFFSLTGPVRALAMVSQMCVVFQVLSEPWLWSPRCVLSSKSSQSPGYGLPDVCCLSSFSQHQITKSWVLSFSVRYVPKSRFLGLPPKEDRLVGLLHQEGWFKEHLGLRIA